MAKLPRRPNFLREWKEGLLLSVELTLQMGLGVTVGDCCLSKAISECLCVCVAVLLDYIFKCIECYGSFLI